MFFGTNLVSWSSKRRNINARSSTKVEYCTVADGVAKACWLLELHAPLSKSTLIYCDNVSVIYSPPTPFNIQRTKHVKIDPHFI
jgi:hypothetical protein